MPQISRARGLAYAIAILVVLVLGGRFALGGGEAAPGDGSETIEAGSGSTQLEKAAEPPARILLVHVVGAVHEPGLYRLRDGSQGRGCRRESQGCQAQGRARARQPRGTRCGWSAGARSTPRRGVSVRRSLAGIHRPPGAPAQKIHLNSATFEELDTLPGVGPITAEKILDYRTEHGLSRRSTSSMRCRGSARRAWRS